MRSGRGGKIYGIDFEVTKKDMTVEPTLEEEVPTPADAELDDLIDKVMDIIDEKIKISQAKALLKVANYDINKIEYAYELACKQENIKNLIGWLTAAIQNGYEDAPIHKVKGYSQEQTEEFVNIWNRCVWNIMQRQILRNNFMDFVKNNGVN